MAEEMANEMLERFDREQWEASLKSMGCTQVAFSDDNKQVAVSYSGGEQSAESPLTRLFNAIRELQKAFEALKLD